MTTVTIAGISSTSAVPEVEIIRVRRSLVGARRDQFVEVPGRPGSWRFPELPGDRTVIVEVDILGSSFADRRDAVRRLADWADTPTGSVALVVDDESDRFYDVMLATAPDVEEWLLMGHAELEYRAGPYALDLTSSVETIDASASPYTGTFAAPDAVDGYPVIELTPAGGILTSFVLTLNGDTISWHGTPGPRAGAPLIQEDEVPLTNPITGAALVDFIGGGTTGYAIYADGSVFDGDGWQSFIAAGDTITLSSISSTVTLGPSSDVELVGAYDPDELDMADVDGRFPLIVSGTNNLHIERTGTATGLAAVLTWRRRYR